MTPTSPIPECESSETEDTPGSIDCVDAAEIKSAFKHQSKPVVHSTALTLDGDNPPRIEDCHNTTLTIPRGDYRESSPVSEEDLTEDVSFLDTVYHMIDIIHLLQKHPCDLPRTVHRKILQSLHTNQGSITESTVDQWSDGRTWIEVLERGSATNRRCTVLNMLEYIGASKWYYSQIEVAKRTLFTKQNKPVGEKGAAMHVLDRIISEHSLLSRKVIINQFSRGKKLRVLVKELGLGILLSPKIW
jgi:hypothetical protein